MSRESRQLDELRREAIGHAAAGRKVRLGRPRLPERLDPALLVVLISVTALLVGGGSLLSSIERSRGYFDPPLVEPIPDRRILENARANPADFVDGVMLGNVALFGRSDGTVLRYDGDLELFSEEGIPRDGLSSPLDLLSRDCGPVIGQTCASGTAFAVTVEGGLAQRNGPGDWRTLLGDGLWRLSNGQPAEQEDVVAWAASQDGRWVLALAGSGGLGLFDQRDASWTAIGPAGGPSATPSRVVFARGRFWLGSEAGLASLDPSVEQPAPIAVTGALGQILDLDATQDGRLLVLREGRSCPGCLDILEVQAPDRVRTLVGETELDPDLSLVRTEHAALQGGRLVLLGQAGVHVYDPVRRAWTALEQRPVDAWFAETNGRALHVAAADRFFSVAGGTTTTERSLERPLIQLLRTDNGLWGLDQEGAVVDLAPETPTRRTWPDAGAPEGARFVTGAALGETVLLLGPQGLLIHDTLARRYAFQPSAQLPPPILAASQPRLLATRQAVWFVDMASGRVWRGALNGEWPDRQITFESDSSVGPLASASADGPLLRLVTSTGTPLLLQAAAPDQVLQLTGSGLQGLTRPIAVAGIPSWLAFTDGAGIWAYNRDLRGWEGPFSGPGSTISELALGQEGLYLRLGSGSVVTAAGESWEGVSNWGGVAPLGLADLTDARAGTSAILMGGGGQVAEYRPLQRNFGRSWTGGSGPVRLLQPSGDIPNWLSGGILRNGETILSEQGEVVVGAWDGPDGIIYVGQNNQGRRYAVELGGAERCLFKGTAPPSGELLDARRLPDGRVVALTTRGAGLYEPNARRWLPVRMPAGRPDSRLEVMGDYLLRLDPPGRLLSAPLVSFDPVDSCAVREVEPDWSQDWDGRAATLDAAAGVVRLLGNEGQVGVWRSGQVSPLLAPPSEGPAVSDLQGAYLADSDLAFGSAEGVWRYDTQARQWRLTAFAGGPRSPSEVDLVQIGTKTAVATVWNEEGQAWGGEQTGNRLVLDPFVLPPVPQIGVSPTSLTDIAERGGLVAVLGTQRLELLTAVRYADVSALDLPSAEAKWHVGHIPNVADVVLFDGEPARPNSLHILDPATANGSLSSSRSYEPGSDRGWGFDRDSVLWRIDREHVLWRCEPGADCVREVERPLELAPADLQAVVMQPDEGALILRHGDASILRLDGDLRPLGSVIGPVVSPSARLLAAGQSRLLWEGPGKALWRVEQDGSATMIAPVVELLRRVGNELTALTVDGLQLVRNGTLVTPEGLSAVSLSSQGEIQGLNADSAPVAGSRAPDADITMPTEIVAVASARMAPEGNELVEGWVAQQGDGQVSFHWMGLCIVPDLIRPQVPSVVAVATTPGATQVPCPRTVESPVRLEAGEHLLDAITGEQGLSLLTDQRFVPFFGGAAAAQPDLLPSSPDEKNAAQRLAEAIERVDGVALLAPPSIEGSEPSQVQVSAGVRIAAQSVSQILEIWSPLEDGWWGWDRAAGQVRIGQGAAAQMLRPEDAFQNGRLLPGAPGRAAYLGAGAWSYLNAHGLWSVEAGTIQPLAVKDFPEALGLSHGDFLLPNGSLRASNGQQGPTSATQQLSHQDLTILESVSDGTVSVSLAVGSQQVNAFGPAGFLFDQRVSVGGANGEAVLLTPLGVVPTGRIEGVFPAPVGATRLGQDGSTLLAASETVWQAWLTNGWTAAAPPDDTRVLAEESGRRWERQRGRVVVVPQAAGEEWRVAGAPDFDADRLIALAGTPDLLVAVTGIGTLTGVSFPELARQNPAQAPNPNATTLDALAVAPGQSPIVWADTATGAAVWDERAGAWTAPSQQPWRDRIAVDRGPLTVAFSGGVGLATWEATRADGASTDISIDWRQGEPLPVDHALSLHAENGRLFMGTPIGLRRLGESAGAVTDEGLFIVDQPAPVTIIGRPVSAPDRLLAQAGSGCLEIVQADGPPTACNDASRLSERLVAADSFWRWTEGDEAVAGAYLLADGTEEPVAQPFGRAFPHDQLRTQVACSGELAELWAAADIVARRPVGSAGVGSGLALDRLDGAAALHCQTNPAHLGAGETLATGLYALGEAGGQVYGSAGWTPVSVIQAEGAAARQAGLVPWEADRLRLILQGGMVEAQHRWEDDIWRPLAWVSGRIALDVPRALGSSGSGLLAITAAGVTPLRSNAGALAVDPDTLTLATPADPDGLATCEPDRIETLDGQAQATETAPGAPLRLRCGDGRVFQGQADGPKELGALALQTEDPFTDRLLIEEGFWRWERRQASPGSPGVLWGAFKGEIALLDGGRFAMDAYRSLAAPFEDRVDIVSADGWRVQEGDLTLASAERQAGTPNPQEVTQVWSDLSGDSVPALCLESDRALQMAGDGHTREVEACRDVAGGSGDPIWNWWATAAGPRADGVAANGVPMERRLVGGRFADLRVTGGPAATSVGLLVPTEIGAILLGPEGATALYASSTPLAAVSSAAGNDLLLGREGVIREADRSDVPSCTSLTQLVSRLPEDVQIRRIDQGQGTATVFLGGPERDQWLVPCGDLTGTLQWTAAIDVAGRARLAAQGPLWTSGSGVVAVGLNSDRGWSLGDGAGQGIQYSDVPQGQPLALLSAENGKAAYLVTTTEMYRVDSDRVISEIVAEAGPLPAMVGPFVEDVAPPQPEEAAPTVSDRVARPAPESQADSDAAPPEGEDAPAIATSPSASSPSPDLQWVIQVPPPSVKEATPTPSPTTLQETVIVLDPSRTKTLQEALTRLGYYHGEIDGLPGRQTRDAIDAWLGSHQKAPSGRLTESEWQTLLLEAAQ